MAAIKDFTWRYLLLGDVEFKLFYYRNRYRNRILSTSPMECNEDLGFEIHILTCKRDLLDALWSLKSFYHFNDIDPMLVVHEDGTFDDNCARTMRDHFKGCRIIRFRQANEEMRRWLRDRRYAREYRLQHFMFHSLKLFDFYRYSNAENIFFLDSDLLFFRRSNEVLGHLRNGRAFFMSDYRSSYSFEPKTLGKSLGIDIITNVNSGLMNIPLKMYDTGLLERFLKLCHDNGFPHHGWMEQTAHAVLLSNDHDRSHRLSRMHQISFAPYDRDTISHHYVYDGSRKNLYLVGFKQLRKAHFLHRIS
ncbi:MAG: hypothetical protein JXA22_04055 [Candidatus Thermoplasmatota archaeon]|nr:hypothetical protein [Candidatus Thermoplasmatota archaeon]